MTIDSIGKSIRNSKPLKILSISSKGLRAEGVSDTPTISTEISTSNSSKSEMFSEGSVCSVLSFFSESIFSPPTSSPTGSVAELDGTPTSNSSKSPHKLSFSKMTYFLNNWSTERPNESQTVTKPKSGADQK